MDLSHPKAYAAKEGKYRETHTHYKETIEGKYSVTEPKGTHILLQP